MDHHIAVPEVTWEDDDVTIPEGEDRTLCFNSDIGTAASYDVRVALRGKGNAAMEGKRDVFQK